MITGTGMQVDTTPVDAATAAELEAAESRAWIDLYAAAPAEWAASAGVSTRRVAGAAVLSWAVTGRRYFSRTIGLGVVEAASASALDDVLDGYAVTGISMFLVQSQPHCLPADWEMLLRERGLEPFDAHDRLVRGGEPAGGEIALHDERDLTVERVTRATADEWAGFLQSVYRLDAEPWLTRLIDRPGWNQYVVRESGTIVGARCMYVDPTGMAWLGMDGPVPGVMTTDYVPDAALCAAIVADGIAQGVRTFHTDIEAPSARRDTPAYDYFASLGFSSPYTRTHWKLA
ncbi:MAG TPA: hypothetical protein VLJ76_04965 [Gaiellaceae bacterium]|nr:hypothetical protein [Gaiellaceae bacterium]